jgi:hypothetical protein
LLLAGSAGAQTTVFYPGVLRYQFWSSDNPNGVQNPSRPTVEAGLAGLPASDDYGIPPTTYTVFDTKEESGDNYADRLSGFFIPSVTTNYVFYISSDDDGDLFLSTDANPLNKRMVAQEVGWSNPDQWQAIGGNGSTIAQKNSSGFSPDGGTTIPFKNGIHLVAGQKYWIEAVHHEGGGGDNVGATFTFFGEPIPTNGAPSALTGSLIGYGYTIPASFTVVNQASNVTANAGMEATFTYVVADTVPDPLNYQWYRNGAVVTNATFQQYTFLASATDNNAQFQCVVGLPFWYSNSLASTSSVAKLTVGTASVGYTNGLKVEQFLGHSRADVENGNTGPANSISLSLNGAENVVNDGINNYARRMAGWYLPPTSGNYVFFVCSDDDSDLFLSTDATSANKQLIAQETSWSNSRNWTNADATLGLASQKRSDQWTNGSGTTPWSSGIALTAGKPYYIEADMHQGGGGDNLGVLAQIVGSPDPTNNAPPIPANQLSLLTTPPTKLTFVTEPKDQKVFEGGLPNFTAKATSDSEFAVQYQWQRSGTNIPGATGSSYSFTTTIADNGTKFNVIASTAQGGLSTNSVTVTLTVQQAVFEPGLALMNYWVNQGADLTPAEGGLLGPPDFTMTVPFFEAGVNNENGDSYINSVSGFFVPAVSQAYDFITTGDDHNDFFLSTDSNPNNIRLICQQPGWCSQLKWTADEGGGADANQKHSATWTNASGTAQWANGISLTAGNKYYMIVWHQEGTGGDSVATTFVKHGDPDPPDNTDSAMTGNLLGFNAPNTATFVAFTNQPQSVTTLSGTTATFHAAGVSDGTILIGTTGQFQTGGAPGAKNFVPLPNVLFQWYRNGVAIPGAITPTYTTPPLKTNDSAQYYAAIRALGQPTWSNSVTATLTVTPDTVKPTTFAASFDQNGLPVLSVSFSKTMNLASISSQANYSLTGGTIVGIIVDTNDARHVQLQLAAAPTAGATLTLSGITDFSGNAPASATVQVDTTVPLINADIGDVSVPDPAWPGYMWLDGTNAYSISTQGSDIWNNADGFNFSYESKTGDFDVVVRQKTFTKVSNWSKGGLMVREDLTSGSRDWNIVNDPTSADGVNAIDGSGNGANTVECNARVAASGASAGWANGPATIPAYPNAWVRLKRAGQVLTAYWSTNGTVWTQEAATDWSTNAAGPMPAAVFVGICCTAHNNNSVTATILNYYYSASFDNYNSSFVASTNPPPGQATLSAKLSGGNVVISWSPAGGTLQSSPNLGTGATWTPVGTANPATVPISGANDKFFRVGP